MLSPRAIAIQGFGFTPLSTAVQGFAPVGIVVPPDPGVLSGGQRLPLRLPLPSFIQLLEEDELLLLCAAGMLSAGILS